MLRSRVSTTLDVGRVAAAVSRPGIDPRVWCSYAVLTSEPFIETRAGQQDVFVSVQLLPTGTEETARVGAIYAGNGFGLYAPLHKDDEVLVLAPSGDPDEGLVVTQRLWSPADPPPSAITAHPEDVTLVVESGKALRLNVQGTGNVIVATDTGKVYLGTETAAQAAVRGTAYRTAEDSLLTALTALQAAIGAFIAAGPVAALSPPQATAVAAALTAYTNAKVAFDAQAATYLSQKVVLE